MRLSLSSGAAPDASPAELVAGCARRGLTAVELDDGGAPHLAETFAERVREARHAAAARGIELCGLYRRRIAPADLLQTADLAAAVGAPVVVPVEGLERPAFPRAAEIFSAAGAQLLLAHGSDPELVESIRSLMRPIPHHEGVGLAWEYRPGADDPARIREVLESAGDALKYVRLHGGGPESQAQDGTGIGALIGRLTLARYRGPLVLTPSNPRYHYAWSAWLGRAAGWGCGSKQYHDSLLSLERSTEAAEQR